jgi:hypothetical protein
MLEQIIYQPTTGKNLMITTSALIDITGIIEFKRSFVEVPPYPVLPIIPEAEFNKLEPESVLTNINPPLTAWTICSNTHHSSLLYGKFFK